MANEKQLIDVNDVYSLFGKYGFARLHVADIDAIPRVDAVEVVHGRWIEQEKYTFGVMYDCSICDNRILDNGHSWNYCPNCGARMDEEAQQ